MSTMIHNEQILEAFYEDDGSGLWFEMADSKNERVRFELSAVQFGVFMELLGDLTYQVRQAQEKAIDTHAMTALQSFGESANSTVGGQHVAIRFRVTKDGTEQAFAVPTGRAKELAALIDECAERALRSSSENRH